MTKLEELKEVIENGMIGEFDDGLLGVFIQGTFIRTDGGLPLIYFNRECIYSGDKLLKVYKLKEEDYQANILFWLKDKEFLNYIEKVVWENKEGEKIVFKDFLEKKDVDWDLFLENCKIENQRWYNISLYYDDIERVKKKEPKKWLDFAFNWRRSLQKDIDWECLESKWKELLKENPNAKVLWEEEDDC